MMAFTEYSDDSSSMPSTHRSPVEENWTHGQWRHDYSAGLDVSMSQSMMSTRLVRRVVQFQFTNGCFFVQIVKFVRSFDVAGC